MWKYLFYFLFYILAWILLEESKNWKSYLLIEHTTCTKKSLPHFWPLPQDTVLEHYLENHAADYWAADPIDMCVTLFGQSARRNNKKWQILPEWFTVAAKKAITCKWFQADPPTVDNWLEIIKGIHEMERLTFLLILRDDLYIVKWTKQVIYLLE